MSKLSLEQHAALNALWKLNYKEVQEVLAALEDQHDEYSTYCGDCGMPCGVVKVDNGIGAYEIHGHKGYDRNVVDGSTCCGETVYTDWQLTCEYDSKYDGNYEEE